MLKDREAVATVAVKDLAAARRFYGKTLGLPSEGDDDPEFSSYRTGGSSILVYRSQYAGTNKATAVTWVVGEDVESVVSALKGKGVKFEHYDMPDTILDGDIHKSGDIKVAWFKDPDGNILNIINR
jgi:catechol 2,3-dioxygenase-like lactoylglutathione lyase family enzyme